MKNKYLPFSSFREIRGDEEDIYWRELAPIRARKGEGIMLELLDKLAVIINRYREKKFDMIIEVLSTQEGGGKSTLSIQLAQRINKLAGKEESLEDMIYWVSDDTDYVLDDLTYSVDSVRIFDEAAPWFTCRDSMSRERLALLERIITSRSNRNVLILNTGSESEIDKIFRERKVRFILYILGRNIEEEIGYFALLVNRTTGFGKDRFGLEKLKSYNIAAGDYFNLRKLLLKLDTCHGFGLFHKLPPSVEKKYVELKQKYNIERKKRNSLLDIGYDISMRELAMISKLINKYPPNEILNILGYTSDGEQKAIMDMVEKLKNKMLSSGALNTDVRGLEKIEKYISDESNMCQTETSG